MPRILTFIFFFTALVQAGAVSLPLDRIGDHTPLWNVNEERIRETNDLAKVVAALDQQLIPRAQFIVEQLRTGYATRQIPLTEVIRARGRQFEIEGQQIEALRDFHLARTRQLAAAGAIATQKTSSPGK